jgi:FkbM family methyltransferase
MGIASASSEKILPNGTIVSYLPDREGEWDVPSMFEHIQNYFQHGISVKEGDVVFDIGANIGIFALIVWDMCKSNVCVHSFEPIPETYKVLRKNMERYSTNNLLTYPFGISDKSTTLAFTHFPNAPGLSTLYPEHMRVGLDQMIRNIDSNTAELPEFFGKTAESPTAKNQGRFNKLRAILGLKTVFKEFRVDCTVKTLSDFIRTSGIDRIDLLKVDVNGSETDVFNGIAREDWPKIKQVVTEVPLGGERLAGLKKLLRANGFSEINIEEQKAVINSGLSYYLLFAVRGNTR